MNKRKILEIKNLKISFTQYDKMFTRKEIVPIKNLSLSVYEGEITAIIGASGSGKSLLTHAVLGILPYNACATGEIIYRNEILNNKKQKKLRGKEIVLVPQSTSYLDPLMKLGKQILKGSAERSRADRLTEIFENFSLTDEVKEQYPFEMSGGMTRRILISTALIENPKLVLADEPTPGLDLTMSKRVMSHFREIAQTGAAVLIITHDIELAVQTCDRIVILNDGTVIEEASAQEFIDADNLKHPYSKALVAAMPSNGFKRFDL